MSHKWRLSALAAVAALLVVSPAEADDRARLDRGEVLVEAAAVSGSPMPRITVRAVVNAPPAAVWSVVSNCNRFERTMPRVTRSKELWRRGGRSMCWVRVDLPWPFDDLVSTTKATETVREGFRRRSWRLHRGNYKHNKGSWTLRPFDAAGRRTLAVYVNHIAPETSIPAWLLKRGTETTMPTMIKRIRKFARRRARQVTRVATNP